MARTRKTKDLCAGCRNDFYNGKNDIGVKECWSFKDAKVVKRWTLGWWTPPQDKSVFGKVTTLDCHHEPGSVAFMERLPEHLGGAKP